ncbi:MAG TPA: TadE/TadG family type IV pilus assembly protein [Lacipirellulaceae bacterium]|nr:TadE/TadG family type IV pilus assembly protein [Lacipirellulaceae bacterium]
MQRLQLQDASLSCKRLPARGERTGAVAVEFAAVAPLLLSIVVGMLELSRVYSVQNTLETAAREGARFTSLDRTGMLLDGQTANQKLTNDVKNYLASAGISRNDVTVRVVDALNPSQPFDLDDPDNDLKLFQIRIDVPYSKVSLSPVKHYHAHNLSAALTFRNGRASLSQ